MDPETRELALETALLVAFFLLLTLPLLGILLSFPIVGVELTDDADLTEAERAVFQPGQYALVYLSLAAWIVTLVFVGCAVRYWFGRRHGPFPIPSPPAPRPRPRSPRPTRGWPE